MIRYIKGTLLFVTESSVIIDRMGLGIEVFVTDRFLSSCTKTGVELRLHTFLNVREDDLSLYGFPTKEELDLYKILIKVNGIGPKAALNVLSTLSPNDLKMAVCSSDIKTITKAPGIGKKTAEKLIIELKDKISIEDVLSTGAETNEASVSTNSEAAEALISLGYSSLEAFKAIKETGLGEDADVEEVLKAALKNF